MLEITILASHGVKLLEMFIDDHVRFYLKYYFHRFITFYSN